MATPSSPSKIAAAASEPGAPPWLKEVALLTGILAALGGYLTVRSTGLSNDAIYRSNLGVLRQAQASDKWAEYQANSIKARIVETTLSALAKDAPGREDLEAKAKEYRDKQPILEAEAKHLEEHRDSELSGSKERLQEKDLLGYAGMIVQLAIALASVAALTRRLAAFYVGVICGAIGLFLTGYAIIVPLLRHH